MKIKQKSDLDLRIFDPAIKNKFIISNPIKTLFSFEVGFQSQDLHILIYDCSPLRFKFNSGFCIFSKKPETGGLNATGSPAISDHIKQTRISQNKHNLFNTKNRSVRGKVRTASFSTLNASTITTVTIPREI